MWNAQMCLHQRIPLQKNVSDDRMLVCAGAFFNYGWCQLQLNRTTQVAGIQALWQPRTTMFVTYKYLAGPAPRVAFAAVESQKKLLSGMAV